jgi:hypothetical protein
MRTRQAARAIGVVVAVVAAAAVVSGASGYSTDTYWGHNNLTASNPPAGTCPGSAAGIACTGWNYWDESDVHWHSGTAYFTPSFICGSDGLLHGPARGGPYDPPGTYGAWWSTWCPGHYNRVSVAHLNFNSSYNYIHAFWQKWP